MSEDLVSVLAALGLIVVAYRYFFTSPSTPTGSSSSTGGSPSALQRRAAALPNSQVQRLLGMFPQLTEGEVRYALVTTRGGPEAVAERVLTRGGLEPPPRGFFPTVQAPSTTPPPSHPTLATPAKPQPIVPPSTHITRLSLSSHKSAQDRAIERGETWSLDGESGSGGGSKGLSGDLKQRKERMVLEARWSLLQKSRKGKAAAA